VAYLVNKSRGAILTINGVDWTTNINQISIADDSVRGSGIISTSGTIILSQPLGAPSIDDYAKTKFLRGHVVIIDVKNPNGTVTRHPRGYLYIVESSYSPEVNELTIEVGCKLYLASLSDNVTNLLSYTDFTIPEEQREYSTLSGAIEAESMILYQDKYGELVKANFFDGDGSGAAVASGEWVSIFGTTTLGVGPLGGTTVVPDKIELTYQVADEDDGTIPDRIDTVETTSNYYLVYPATIWERSRPEDGLAGVGGSGTTSEVPTTSRVSDDCGSSPITPDTGTTTGTTETCSEGYKTVPYKLTSAVTSVELSTTWYEGPGNQISARKTEKWGPAVELNSQYYADLYAFCVWGYSSACTPSGNCPLTGLTNVYHGYTQDTYIYGPGGEVIRLVKETYENELSAAKAEDWRSGVAPVNGILEYSGFTSIGTSRTYLSKRTITDYEYYEDRTIETQTTYTAPTEGANGVGINSGCFDATCGVVTTERSISTTTNGPNSPDSVSQSNNVTAISFVIDDVRSPVNYTSTPSETNPVIQKIQLQLPLSSGTGDPATVASNYLRYQRKLIEGDSAGLRIVEALRSDIITNWRPGMPFRYYDPRVGKILAFRMNASSWAMDSDECIISTDGIFLGETNGTIAEPSNLVGNETRPELPNAPLFIGTGTISGTTLTIDTVELGTIQTGSIISGPGIPENTYVTQFQSGTGGVGTYTIYISSTIIFNDSIYVYSTIPSGEILPIVDDESGLVGGSFSEVIKVNFYLRCLFSTGGGDNGYGVISAPPMQYVDGWQTWVCYVSGGLYAPGGLLSTSPTGGVPLSNGNVLMTGAAVAVDADLFA
jgi:hypothetical protein